jgi:hypothetical protein
MKPSATQKSLGASHIYIETDPLDTDCFLMDDESPSDEYIVMLATDGVPGLREYLSELSR